MSEAEPAGVAVIAHPGAELYGSDRVMLETVAGLVERGWRVVVAVPTDGPLLDSLHTAGAETVILPVPVLRKSVLSPAGGARFVGRSISASRAIARLLASVRPEVVYVSTLTLPLWLLEAKAKRIPTVVHVHESERQAPLPVQRMLAAPLRLADRIVVNSVFSRETLLRAAPALRGRSTVVYNGVRGPDTVTPARTDLADGLRLVYVGRLSPRKGVDVVIDALARLGERGVDATLDLVGSVFPGYEWYEQQLREQVALAGLESRVTFRGFEADVWRRLADADVAVVPSRLDEPFGNTAVEAVLAGRPVVVSAIGGLAEAIDGFPSAVPVPADDPTALADAVERIRANWPAFQRTARALAPIAADRYSIATYREAVASEITRVALPRLQRLVRAA